MNPQTSEWLLPHFPDLRPERPTTKTRIVFDASAEFQGKSLNSEALPGPKLQTDKFSILVWFVKELVAFVGDVSQMYHQHALTPEDRKLRRFLWRDLDQIEEPDVWEFLRYVFGRGGVVIDHSVHSMHGRSMQMTTKKSTLSQLKW